MKRMVAFVAMWGVLAIGSAAPGQEAHTLRRIFKQGESERYKTVIKFEQNDTEAVLVTTEVTREVKADGVAVVATTVDSIVLRARGAEMPFPGGSGQVVLSTYDKSGKMLKQEAIGGRGNVGQLLNVARPSVFVEKALKVGETVKDEIPLGPESAQKASVTITLVAIDKKDADTPVECLRYKVVTEAGPGARADGPKNRGEVILRMSRADGKLVSAEGTMEGIPLPTGGTTKLSYKVTRTTEPAPK